MLSRSRTKLPSPMVDRGQISVWSILKNCIGKELYKITMPVVFNEPVTFLQRACECIQFSYLVKMADESDDPVERMELICAFIIATISANCNRLVKPFNPLFYETYEVSSTLSDGTIVRALTQQVSHHPPISAYHAESDYFLYTGSIHPKMRFWGRTVEVHPEGLNRIYLKRHKENYIYRAVACSLHNIVVGNLWFEHVGPLDINCRESKVQANISFKSTGWFGKDLHRFDGVICQEKKKMRYLYGKWSDYIKSVNYPDYEEFLKDCQKKTFRIPDSVPDDSSTESQINDIESNLAGIDLVNNNNSISSPGGSNRQETKTPSKADKKKDPSRSDLTDIPKSRTLWRRTANYLKEYYSFSEFTMSMNELTPELAKTLPRTDSRFRPDVRKLEEGDLEGAAREKDRLEEKQRNNRAKDGRFREPSQDFLWFEFKDVDYCDEKNWSYRGGYWENKCNLEKFPDIFS